MDQRCRFCLGHVWVRTGCIDQSVLANWSLEICLIIVIWLTPMSLHFFKKFWRTFISPFWQGHWYPVFGLLMRSALDSKARVFPSLACFVTCTQWIPQICLWCKTCPPLHSQHCSQAFLINLLFQALASIHLISVRLCWRIWTLLHNTL